MYKDKFVLSIIHDGNPVKESGSRDNRQVAIPFGSEYKLRLKNKNDRSCTARVTIDGTPVSNFGDIIVNAGGTVDLERFITNSMNSGKKFKFVELNHPDVDDPTKSENGLIKVEFRLAKEKNGIKISSDKWEPPKDPWCPPRFKGFEDNDGCYWVNDNDWTFTSDGGTSSKSKSKHRSSSVMYCSSNIGALTSSFCEIDNGATIEGSNSNQSFTYSNLEVESHCIILKLKMIGIKQGVKKSKKRYCTQCGHQIRKHDRYCGGCGCRL
jgi:hypothetical protein